jgi:hypothetical protein
VNQLQAYNFVFDEFAFAGESITLEPTHLTTTEHLNHVLKKYGEPIPSHARFMRTLSSTSKAVWSDPANALISIERILRGDSPQNQVLFERTFFHRLSDQEPKEFWAGIWARLMLAIYSSYARGRVTDYNNRCKNALGLPWQVPGNRLSRTQQLHGPSGSGSRVS